MTGAENQMINASTFTFISHRITFVYKIYKILYIITYGPMTTGSACAWNLNVGHSMGPGSWRLIYDFPLQVKVGWRSRRAALWSSSLIGTMHKVYMCECELLG